jgi:hypothetical protein
MTRFISLLCVLGLMCVLSAAFYPAEIRAAECTGVEEELLIPSVNIFEPL